MLDRIKRVYPEIALWAALTVGSAIFFAATLATDLHQLAIGLLTTSVALLATTTLFELAWEAVADLLDRRPLEDRRHRHRG